MGVALLDLQIDDMAPIAGVADAPDAQPSVLRNLWASVLMMALYGATDATPSRQRDEARWYLTMRNNADLRFAIDAAGLDEPAFSDRIEMLAASGWRVTEQWRRGLRQGLERGFEGERHIDVATLMRSSAFQAWLEK